MYPCSSDPMYSSLCNFPTLFNFLSCEKQHFYLFCLSVNILFCLIRLVQLDNASKCAAVGAVMMIADDSGGWTVAIRNKDRFVLPFSAYHQFSSSLSSMSKKKGERICDSSASDRSAAPLLSAQQGAAKINKPQLSKRVRSICI